ncbi:MAG: serine O-acetyltransferase, partial [Candidatus Diapherotrites archaeon]|nr:serine O-acetyltransferase [Candidatus Diapherotrites archaeon]
MFEFARLMASDIRAVKQNDPAAKNYAEVLLCHTPLWAIMTYRIAHPMHKAGLPLLPRFALTMMKVITGVEIHPNA